MNIQITALSLDFLHFSCHQNCHGLYADENSGGLLKGIIPELTDTLSPGQVLNKKHLKCEA